MESLYNKSIKNKKVKKNKNENSDDEACCDACQEELDCEGKGQKNRLIKAYKNVKQNYKYQFPPGFAYGLSHLPICKNTSFSLNTNASGAIWAQINLGVLCELATFAQVKPTDGTLPRGNVFILGNSSAALTYSGDNNLNNNAASVNGAADANILALNSLMSNTGDITAYRPGPCKIRIEYTGSLDSCSGTIYVGISESWVTGETGTTNNGNSFLPDLNYSTATKVEDCRYSLSCPITSAIEAYFFPSDQTQLNLNQINNPYSSIAQRLNIIVKGADISKVGLIKVTCTASFEAIPSASLSDLIPEGTSIACTHAELAEAAELYKQRIYISDYQPFSFGSRIFGQN
jgi:hypothetical protein